MKKQTILIALLFLLLFGWIGWSLLNKPRTGYVLVQELYNNFELKKELEKKFKSTSISRQQVLDSLQLNLQVLARRVEETQGKNDTLVMLFQRKRGEFAQMQQTLSEDNDALGQQYDNEILSQLNQYVKDFGEESGYTYIFGNDGNGSLMYAKDAENITDKVTKYINERYQGGK